MCNKWRRCCVRRVTTSKSSNGWTATCPLGRTQPRRTRPAARSHLPGFVQARRVSPIEARPRWRRNMSCPRAETGTGPSERRGARPRRSAAWFAGRCCVASAVLPLRPTRCCGAREQFSRRPGKKKARLSASFFLESNGCYFLAASRALTSSRTFSRMLRGTGE